MVMPPAWRTSLDETSPVIERNTAMPDYEDTGGLQKAGQLSTKEQQKGRNAPKDTRPKNFYLSHYDVPVTKPPDRP
jgi:hypothetical protein